MKSIKPAKMNAIDSTTQPLDIAKTVVAWFENSGAVDGLDKESRRLLGKMAHYAELFICIETLRNEEFVDADAVREELLGGKDEGVGE